MSMHSCWCLPFVQVAPKCLPFAQDTTKQPYLSRKATMGIFGLIVLIDLSLRILNKSNAILAACLHLLATFGLECRAFACKKDTICKKVVVGGGGGGRGGGQAPCPSPSAAYVYINYNTFLTLRMASCGLVKTIVSFYRQDEESAFEQCPAKSS